jgi:CubicO group peptidase (beta-lactamase class C family)
VRVRVLRRDFERLVEEHVMSGGLSTARLARRHAVMAKHVENSDVPGLITMVCRRGEVHVDVIGTKTSDGDDPIQRDTIFRISSMTKPITAVAAMMLVEECKLRLDEPVDRLLPELANRTVLNRLDGPLDDTVPAKRPISLRDLLTFRMGFAAQPRGFPRPPRAVRRSTSAHLHPSTLLGMP